MLSKDLNGVQVSDCSHPMILLLYQILMTYCSEDVKATHAVFQHVWHEFLERFEASSFRTVTFKFLILIC